MSDGSSIVELHIDELVLRGFARSDRFRIAEALQNELTRLFAEQPRGTGVTHSAGADRLDAGTFRVAGGATPAAIGRQVGQAVYGQIGPAARGPRQLKAGRRRQR